MAMKRYFALPGLALLILSTNNLVASQPEYNGVCTAEFCTCQITYPAGDFEPPSCPEWMNEIYTDLFGLTSSCEEGTAVGGSRVCMGNGPIFSQDIPWTSTTAIDSRVVEGSGGDICVFGSFVLRGGTLEDGEAEKLGSEAGRILLNYTLTDPVPKCSQVPPFTMAPSAAPVAMNTAPPTNSGSSSLFRFSTVLVGVVGVVSVVIGL